MFGVPVGKSGRFIVGQVFNEVITEGVGGFEVENKDTGEKDYYLEGIFMQADILNNNKRVYPRNVLDNAVDEYIKDKVLNKTAWGELTHPDSPRINLDNVCMLVTEIKNDNGTYYGKSRVAHEDCPAGKILRGLIKTGGKLGVSSRGLGSANPTKFEGEDCNLVDQFNLRAIDVVADPSCSNAMVEAIQEEKQYILDGSNGSVVELNEETYKIFESELESLPIRQEPKQEQVFEAIKNFLNTLR